MGSSYEQKQTDLDIVFKLIERRKPLKVKQIVKIINKGKYIESQV